MFNKKTKRNMVIASVMISALLLAVFVLPELNAAKIELREYKAPFLSDNQLESEGHIKESLTITDEFSLSLDNEDGSKTLYLFAAPIAYYDSDSNLRLVDNNLEEITDQSLLAQGYLYKNAENSFDILYPDVISSTKGFVLKTEDTLLEVCPDITEKITANKSNNKDIYNYNTDSIQYSNVFGEGISMNCFNTILGVQNEIVIQQFNDKNSFRFIVKVPGLVPDSSNNQYVLFKDQKTKGIGAVIYPPFVKDSYTGKYDKDNAHFSYSSQISLETINKEEGIYAVILLVDKDFLTNTNTQYPVRISSSFYMYKKKQPDSSVYSNFGNTNQYLSNFSGLGACDYYGEGRTFVRFEYMQNYTILPEKIQSAYYYNYELTDIGSDLDAGLFNVIDPWCSLGSKWNNQAKCGNEICDINIKGAGKYQVDITDLIKSWMTYNRNPENGKDPMQGFLLKAKDETGNWNMLSSADNGIQIPYIELTITK